MRYHCTIYSHAYTVAGTEAFGGTEPAFDAPMADVMVKADGARHAAARAWVRCVGRERARLLERSSPGNPKAGAQEANPRAVAASLRKTPSRIGEVFAMDNVLEAWFIKVEPACPRLPRLRLSPRLLWRLLRNASPN